MKYKAVERKIAREEDRQILIAPLATEKCIRQIEADNVLCFVVARSANKQDVKKAVEQNFNVKVSRVNIQNSVDGRKKAFVRLDASNLAADVSADLGFI